MGVDEGVLGVRLFVKCEWKLFMVGKGCWKGMKGNGEGKGGFLVMGWLLGFLWLEG